MSIFADIAAAARKRADYRRTLNALSSMPESAQADLGIDGQDLRQVAHKAVYG